MSKVNKSNHLFYFLLLVGKSFLQKYKRVVLFSILVLSIFFLVLHSISARAAGITDTVAIEPENGTLSGNISIISDPTASNGQYVTFGSASTPTPTFTPTPTPQAQLSISNLTVYDTLNAKKYSLQTNMQIGNVLYGDRTYTIKTLPVSVAGFQWIRTANSSKSWNAGATLVSFSISQQATIYVGLDTRLKKLPWMDASWVLSGMKLTDNEGHTITFALYQKTFPAGTVNLGPNNGPSASDMYTVIAH